MKQRRRFKQALSLQDRLSAFMRAMRERAESAPAGSERDELLEKARKAETAAAIDGWANSPELQPPK